MYIYTMHVHTVKGKLMGEVIQSVCSSSQKHTSMYWLELEQITANSFYYEQNQV